MPYAGRTAYREAALFLLCLVHLMCILDISIINIAIPSIQQDLNLATADLHSAITSYVLTYGGFLLVGGKLGDIYGRRRLLLGGLICFVSASAIAGLSTSASALYLGRALQGLGAAVLTPAVMSFVTGLFAEGQERNRALGILGAVSGAGFALGLVVGGMLTSTVGWRWVFFINLPIGIGVLLPAIWLLPETEQARQQVNIPGALLATGGLALATYSLTATEKYGILSLHTLGLCGLAALMLYLFAKFERRAPHPLIPSLIWRHRSLQMAVFASTIFGAFIGPMTLILTLYLQNVTRFNPWHTGLAFLPQELVLLIAANWAGRTVGRLGARTVLMIGLAAFAVGAIWLTQISPAGGYSTTVLSGLICVGFGIGNIVVPGSIAAAQGLPPQQHGLASGIWNTGSQVGTALGMALLMAVASGYTNRLLAAAGEINAAQAVVAGYKVALVGAALLAVGGITGLVLIGRRQDPRPVPEF